MKGSLMQIRRVSKISGTTSTSLQRYASSVNNDSNPEQNATVKSFYNSKKDPIKIFNKLNDNLYEDKVNTSNHNDSFENNTED